MAVSIHGNNGFITTNGTAAAPSFAAPDSDTGLYFGTNLIHATTSGVNRFNIDASGRVGIGTTNPSAYSNLAYNLVVRTTGNTGVTLRSGSTSTGSILFASGDNNTSNEGIFQYKHNDKAFEFNNYGGGAEKFIYKIQGNEKLRIDSAGNVNFGAEKAVALPSGSGIQVYNSSAPRIKLVNDTTGNAAGDGLQIYVTGSSAIFDHKEDAEMRFYTDGTEKVRITSGFAASFGNSSPPAWADDSGYYNIQLGKTGFLRSDTDTSNTFMTIGQNAYKDSGGWKYAVTAGASSIFQQGGDIVFETAASGTAGNALTLTPKVRIKSGGNVNIGGNYTQTSALLAVTTSANAFGIRLLSGSNSVCDILNNDSAGNAEIRGYYNNNTGTRGEGFRIESNGESFFNPGGNTGLRIKSTGEVRIGSNSTTASTAGDDLVIEGSSDRGLSIISGTSSSANIYFGDSSDADVGRIAYQHNDNALDFSTNAGSTALRITSGDCVYSSNFGFGADNRWKIRPNTSNTELAFEYSTSSTLADTNIKMFLNPSGRLNIKTVPAAVGGTMGDYGIMFQASTTPTDGQVIQGITFNPHDTQTGRARAGIAALANAQGGSHPHAGADLSFMTRFSADGHDLDVSTDQRLRIDSRGDFFFNTPTRSGMNIWNMNGNDQRARYQFYQTVGNYRGAAFHEDRGDANGFDMVLSKARGGTGTGVVSAGDTLGRIIFSGADGTRQVHGACIQGFTASEGSIGSGRMPGKLLFRTGKDHASAGMQNVLIMNHLANMQHTGTWTMHSTTTSGDFVVDISNLTNNGGNNWRKCGVFIWYNGIDPDATDNRSIIHYTGVGSVSTWNWEGDSDTLTNDSFTNVSVSAATATSFRLNYDVPNQNTGSAIIFVHTYGSPWPRITTY